MDPPNPNPIIEHNPFEYTVTLLNVTYTLYQHQTITPTPHHLYQQQQLTIHTISDFRIISNSSYQSEKTNNLDI